MAGVCVAGGIHGRVVVHDRGGHAWQERRPIKRAVRILLEFILVGNYIYINRLIERIKINKLLFSILFQSEAIPFSS